MFNKETLDLLLSKIGEDKLQAFIGELKKADGIEQIIAVLKKYGIEMTEAEVAEYMSKRELSDDEAALAAGGCSAICDCDYQICHGYMGY